MSPTSRYAISAMAERRCFRDLKGANDCRHARWCIALRVNEFQHEEAVVRGGPLRDTVEPAARRPGQTVLLMCALSCLSSARH